MSDANPPGEPDSSTVGEPAAGTDKPGLVQRFRELPLWIQILISVLVGGVLAAAGLLIASAASSKNSTTATPSSTEMTTTTTPSETYTHGAAVLLIVTELSQESGTPPTQPATTPVPTSSTVAPTTTSSTPTTEFATTTPATTETSTSTTSPVTTPPARPVSTSSTESATTAPAATNAATSSTAPATTTPPAGVLPAGTLADSPQAFATAWNESVQGTGVPSLSAGPNPPANFTEESAGGVSAYVANLGKNVWLVALAQARGAAIAQGLLVWEPNGDSAQQPAENALYRDAFQALMKTVNSSITTVQRLKVTAQLGLTRQHPPYPDTTQKSAVQPPHQYDLFNVDPAHPTQPGPATVISVITAQT